MMNDVDEEVKLQTAHVAPQLLRFAVGLFVDDELPVGRCSEVTHVAAQRLDLLVNHVCGGLKNQRWLGGVD